MKIKEIAKIIKKAKRPKEISYLETQFERFSNIVFDELDFAINELQINHDVELANGNNTNAEIYQNAINVISVSFDRIKFANDYFKGE